MLSKTHLSKMVRLGRFIVRSFGLFFKNGLLLIKNATGKPLGIGVF